MTGGGEHVKQDLPKAVTMLSEIVNFAEAKHALGTTKFVGMGGLFVMIGRFIWGRC